MELLPLLMSIPVKFLMAISGESVNEAMDAMLDTMERDLWAAKFDFRSMENSFSYQGLLVSRNLSLCASGLGGGGGGG